MKVDLTEDEIAQAVAMFLASRGLSVTEVKVRCAFRPERSRHSSRQDSSSPHISPTNWHAVASAECEIHVGVANAPDVVRTEKRSVSWAVRTSVYNRDGWSCFYCGRHMPPSPCSGTHGAISVDHLLPSSRGGSDEPANLVTACKHCNSQKGDKTLAEYTVWLAGRDPAGAAHLDEGDPDDPARTLPAWTAE